MAIRLENRPFPCKFWDIGVNTLGLSLVKDYETAAGTRSSQIMVDFDIKQATAAMFVKLIFAGVVIFYGTIKRT